VWPPSEPIWKVATYSCSCPDKYARQQGTARCPRGLGKLHALLPRPSVCRSHLSSCSRYFVSISRSIILGVCVSVVESPPLPFVVFLLVFLSPCFAHISLLLGSSNFAPNKKTDSRAQKTQTHARELHLCIHKPPSTASVLCLRSSASITRTARLRNHAKIRRQTDNTYTHMHTQMA